MSNKYSDLLMQALDIAIDEKISTLLFDKTILATVLSVVDLDTGEYRVKYKDGIISAFAADPKETFKQGDAVYVTVPESDFSNKKFISHRITNNSLSTGQYSELANTIFEVSPNFSDLGYTYVPYEEGQDSYGLIVGLNSSINILRSAPALANSRFKAYANLYEYIQISASFLNEFTQDHTQGDYGIELVLTNIDNLLVSYFLNLNDFNGDPYHLATWSPQSIVVKIPKGLIKALNAIYFYETGFVSEGNKANLFMSDFSLNFVDKVDLTEIPYYLNILPLDGIAFTTSQTSLHLEGHIYHIGEELPESSCLFLWFERDLSVAPGDEAYDKRAGWGWRPIEGATNRLLTRTKTQVSWLKNYKLVAVYNSTTLMTKEITLINGSLDIEIEQVTSGNAIYLKLTKSGYTGDWYYLASDGNLVAIPQSPRSGTSPDIVPYLLYSPMTFYCLVYLGSVYQGELNYVMQNIESKDDVSVVFSGESLFSYDANGDINIYDAELERSLQAEIVWKKGIISSSPTIRWLDFENNVIGSSWVDYSNKDSMLKKVRVDTTENILYYTVKHKFKQTPSKNNSFRIEISTTDGLVYSFDKEIVFTKTGDPGTNGTRYQSLITVTSSNKFVGVNSSNTAVTLGCKVYKDLTEFSGANITWTPVNLAVVSQSGAAISVKANNSNRKRYVKATINITDEGKTTTLYDFFPVDSCASLPVIDISELPKYVQYAANGRNPLFRKQVPTIRYNGATATIASGDTAVIKIANGLFKPVDEFNPDNPIGLLTVTVSGITIYHPVPTYINTFGNEAINGWDGVELDLGRDGRHIFSPSVGAGKKNSANQFTGVVMGIDDLQKPTPTSSTNQALTGLFGYKDGLNTFALREDGQAFFGAAGDGRIWLNGTNATIEGGGGGTSTSGMTITLSAAANSADAIRVGNGNFIVTYGGKLTATGADILGTLNAKEGYIGRTSRTSSDGWTITTNRLFSGSRTNYVALDSGTADVNQTIWAGNTDPTIAPFRVTRAGALTATSADITGIIKATSGYIGGTSSGWSIISKAIFSGESSFVIQANSKYYTNQECTAGERTVSQATEVASYAAIANTDKASFLFKNSTVTYYTLRSSFNSNYVRLLTNGTYTIFAGHIDGSSAPFSVTHGGTLKATNATILGKITANEGTIGGWKISSLGLNNGEKIYLKNTGAMLVGDNFSVTSAGVLKATGAVIGGKVTADEGKIGGWTVINGKIYSGNVTLYSLTKDNAEDEYKYTENDVYRFWAGSSNTSPSTANFFITNAGVMLAKNATVTGTINANTGYIGRTFNDNGSINNAGWTITGTRLISNKKRTNSSGTEEDIYVALSTQGNYAFYAGATGYNDNGDTSRPAQAPFWVKFDGSLKATSATIEGKITANEGKIAGWVISGNKLLARPSSTDISGSTNLYLNGGPWEESDKDKYVLYMHSDSGTFSVNSSGIMSATGAVISGNITAKTGNIGGWGLSSSRLYGLKTSRIGLAQSGVQVYDKNGTKIDGLRLVFWSGVKYTQSGNDTSDTTGEESSLYLRGDSYFGVSTNGKLYCNGAEITGKITADSGIIGDWEIKNNRLENSDGTVWLSSSGGLRLGDNFSVSSSGVLSARGANIGGTISASSGWIGNWKIANDRLQSDNGSVYLGTNGFKLGNNFSVNSSGKLTATGASISGSITMGSGSSINWDNITESGTVPYDEAGDADDALRSAKSYTDREIEELDIPVLPSYITSTKITSTTVESPKIIGGEIYAATFYAVEDDKSKYLEIKSTGIGFETGTSTAWSLSYNVTLQGHYDELRLICTNTALEISSEGSINIDSSYYITLDAGLGIRVKDGLSSTKTLAQYVEDHAGTAVFG